MRLKSFAGSVALIAGFSAGSWQSNVQAALTPIPITDDSYMDSTYSVDPNTSLLTNTQNVNFDTSTTGTGGTGAAGYLRVKAVSSNGSGGNPGNSKVHGIFKVPQALFDGVANGSIKTAFIGFYLGNNSLNTVLSSPNPPYTDPRDVELHPMTRNWSLTNSTWRQADTGVPWSTTNTAADHDDPGFGGGGGDYDASREVLTVNPNVPSKTYVYWNITPFFSDPVAMQELHDDGALLKVTDETNFEDNRFFSMNSFESGASTAPYIYAFAPEPASATVAVLALLPLARRRRRSFALPRT